MGLEAPQTAGRLLAAALWFPVICLCLAVQDVAALQHVADVACEQDVLLISAANCSSLAALLRNNQLLPLVGLHSTPPPDVSAWLRWLP